MAATERDYRVVTHCRCFSQSNFNGNHASQPTQRYRRKCSWATGEGRGVLTARRYASALYAVVACVCLFVIRQYRIETTGWIELFFGVKAPPIPFMPHCVVRKVGISGNKSTSLWNFVPNSGLQKMSPQQVDRAVNKTRRRSSLLTTLTTVNASWLDAHRAYTVFQKTSTFLFFE